MKSLNILTPFLIFIVLGYKASAAPTNPSVEILKIEKLSSDALEPLKLPQQKLEQSFRSALERLNDSSRKSGDETGVVAAIAMIDQLDRGVFVNGTIRHPEVLKLCSVFAQESDKNFKESAPAIDRILKKEIEEMQELQEKLETEGQYRDWRVVTELIEKIRADVTEIHARLEDLNEKPVRNYKLPKSLAVRNSRALRLERIKLAGGSREIEDAVLLGLKHLQKTQNADGSWYSSNQAAMTGLALLALLGHGEEAITGKSRECTLKAIQYLVELGATSEGKISSNTADNHWPYEHGIATQALGEAASYCASLGIDIPKLRMVSRKAAQIIVNHQNRSGGWDYSYDQSNSRGGDLSITSWQLKALKATKQAGIEVDGLDSCIDKSLAYVANLQNKEGGFGYTSQSSRAWNGTYYTLTGAGVLSLLEWGKKDSNSVAQGVSYIRKYSKFKYHGDECDLYSHYYESQAMHLQGGEDWLDYQSMVMPELVDNQSTEGTWENPQSRTSKFRSNQHYLDTICLLILQVYYRSEPAQP